MKNKEQKEPKFARGESHLPNPSVNREKRPQIMRKRVRNIIKCLQGKMSLTKRRRLEGKLANYQGELDKAIA